MKKKYLFPIIAIPVLLLVVGLTFLLIPSGNTEEELLKRVTQLWEARKAGNWTIVYDLYNEEYKKATPKEQFLSKPHLQVVDFEVTSAKVDKIGKGLNSNANDQKNSNNGWSSVSFNTIKAAIPLRASMKEIWVFENGAWYVKTDNPKTPFTNPAKNKP
ncbi:MAG: hypothetical protein V2B19_25730 [Pseudomonadota bacterium]